MKFRADFVLAMASILTACSRTGVLPNAVQSGAYINTWTGLPPSAGRGLNGFGSHGSNRVDASTRRVAQRAPSTDASHDADVVRKAIERARHLNDINDWDGAYNALGGLPSVADDDLNAAMSHELARANARVRRVNPGEWAAAARKGIEQSATLVKRGKLEEAMAVLKAVGPLPTSGVDAELEKRFSAQLKAVRSACVMGNAMKHGNRPPRFWQDLYELESGTTKVVVDSSLSPQLRNLLQKVKLSSAAKSLLRDSNSSVLVNLTQVDGFGGAIEVNVKLMKGPYDGEMKTTCVGSDGEASLRRSFGAAAADVMAGVCPGYWALFADYCRAVLVEASSYEKEWATFDTWQLGVCDVRAWSEDAEHVEYIWRTHAAAWIG